MPHSSSLQRDNKHTNGPPLTIEYPLCITYSSLQLGADADIPASCLTRRTRNWFNFIVWRLTGCLCVIVISFAKQQIFSHARSHCSKQYSLLLVAHIQKKEDNCHAHSPALDALIAARRRSPVFFSLPSLWFLQLSKLSSCPRHHVSTVRLCQVSLSCPCTAPQFPTCQQSNTSLTCPQTIHRDTPPLPHTHAHTQRHTPILSLTSSTPSSSNSWTVSQEDPFYLGMLSLNIHLHLVSCVGWHRLFFHWLLSIWLGSERDSKLSLLWWEQRPCLRRSTPARKGPLLPKSLQKQLTQKINPAVKCYGVPFVTARHTLNVMPFFSFFIPLIKPKFLHSDLNTPLDHSSSNILTISVPEQHNFSTENTMWKCHFARRNSALHGSRSDMTSRVCV